MNIQRHGISIGMERIDGRFLVSMKAVGRLTHEDYQQVIPMIEGALATLDNPRIRAFVDATELEGWDLRAAWDDLRFDLKHGSEFERVAVVGNRRWLELGTKVFGWFVSGDVRYFEEPEPAYRWLIEGDAAEA